jgi:hypothetical protein
MVRQIAAIVLILICTSVAWVILGTTIFARTYDVNSNLSSRVESTWGAPEEQAPPVVGYQRQESKTVETEENGKKVRRAEVQVTLVPVTLEGSRINADFHIDYRQKGLLWFSTYVVNFSGQYDFHNPSAADENFLLQLPLPAKAAVYDNIEFLLDEKPLQVEFSGSQATAQARIPARANGVLQLGYRSRGMNSWRYKLGHDVSQARNFHLVARTDFSGFDFPDNSLSPTEKRRTNEGWELGWNYQNMVSGYDIALQKPQKLQLKPLAGRISYFAPVSLFFFFFVIFILPALRGIDLHPMNYFFLALRVFCVPPPARISRGPRVDSCGVCDLGDRVGGTGCQLFATSDQHALRDSGVGHGAADLSGAVFVCILFRGVYRLGGDDWGGGDAVCSNADDRKNPLAGKIQSHSGTGRPDGPAFGIQFGRTRPGLAPVGLVSDQTRLPLTQTFSMPVASSKGCLNVDRSMTVLGLKRTKSA